MNATSLEKSKRGNLYVYRFATGSQTPEYPPPVTSVTKKIIPSSVWGGLIKSKSKSKSKTKISTNGEEKEEKEKERERKSVSSVENILMMSLESRNGIHKDVVMKGRKSVEVEEEKGKGMGMEIKGKKEEGGRKSVSHVENNVAYVGRFVEDNARKSNGAKLENDVISMIELLQVKVLVTDMPAFMQIHAFQCARNTYDSLEKFSAKHIAYNLKKVQFA
ncbi:unnamed protein product [Amaranthus hypochondriacus]